MFGINLDLSDLGKRSKQQLSDFKKELKKFYVDHPEVESQISAYMEQIEKGFEELNFQEPTKVPDVFLKEFRDL